MTTTTHWSDALLTLRACEDAIDFAAQHATYEAAWAACERGDWMVWLLGCLSGRRGDPRRDALLDTVRACGASTGVRFEVDHVRPGNYLEFCTSRHPIDLGDKLRACADFIRIHYPAPPPFEQQP